MTTTTDDVTHLRALLADEHAKRCAAELDHAGAEARAERAEASASGRALEVARLLTDIDQVTSDRDTAMPAEIARLKAERDDALAACAEMRAALMEAGSLMNRLQAVLNTGEAVAQEHWNGAAEMITAALARTDLGRDVVVVPRLVVERWASGVDQHYVIAAEMHALLKKGGG